MLALRAVGSGAQVQSGQQVGTGGQSLSSQQVRTDTFDFRFEGRKYVGLLDVPTSAKPTGLIILVPGSGETDVVRAYAYRNTRRHFN